MSDGKVIEFERTAGEFFRSLDRPAASSPGDASGIEADGDSQGHAAEPAAEAVEAGVSLETLSPLPQPGDPYKAHARLANGPLATLFLIPKGGLPDGIDYAALYRVRLIAGKRPGDAPALLLQFRGGLEAEIEGRGMLGLCEKIGRHRIHWIREHPTGRDDGTAAVFIRLITIREMER